jgi:hypothetical protein
MIRANLSVGAEEDADGLLERGHIARPAMTRAAPHVEVEAGATEGASEGGDGERAIGVGFGAHDDDGGAVREWEHHAHAGATLAGDLGDTVASGVQGVARGKQLTDPGGEDGLPIELPELQDSVADPKGCVERR